MVACNTARSDSFQPAGGTSAVSPSSGPTLIPSISRTGPETLVKFIFSSCSQYQSEASSVRLR